MNALHLLPKFLQAKERLTDDIMKSGWPIGRSIPSARALAEKYDVAYLTMRRAIDALVEEGILDRPPGKMARVAKVPVAENFLSTTSSRLRAQQKKTGNILILTMLDAIEDTDSYIGYTFRTLEKTINDGRWNPIIRLVRSNSEFPEVIRFDIRPELIDGIVVTGIYQESLAKGIFDSGVPVVFIDYQPRIFPMDSVTTNNFMIAAQAMTHLLALGHRKIDFLGHGHGIGRPDVDAVELEAYWRMYLSINQATGSYYSINAHTMDAIVDSMMEPAKRPTAMFVSSPDFAMRLTDALVDRGLEIPRDLSVITTGGGHIADYPLTSISVDWNEITKLALMRLEARIRREVEPGARLSFAGQIINRDTTAAVKS